MFETLEKVSKIVYFQTIQAYSKIQVQGHESTQDRVFECALIVQTVAWLTDISTGFKDLMLTNALVYLYILIDEENCFV